MIELEKIQEQIDSLRTRYAEVKQEVASLKTQLEAKRKEQGAAIVESKDASKAGKEIVTLQSQITGAEEAQEQIRETTRGLVAERAALLRGIALDHAENKKADIQDIEADIYSLLVQAAKRLPDLYNSRGEYVAQLTAAGSKDAKDEGRKIVVLHETLRREIPNLLDCFPRSVLLEELPSPSTVRGEIRPA